MSQDEKAHKAPLRGGVGEVDAYLAALPEASRGMMEAMRSAIRAAAPEAEEVLSYGMPAFQQGGERFVYYAAWTAHCSLYGLTESVLEAFAGRVAPYRTPKGMLRFGLEQDLP